MLVNSLEQGPEAIIEETGLPPVTIIVPQNRWYDGRRHGVQPHIEEFEDKIKYTLNSDPEYQFSGLAIKRTVDFLTRERPYHFDAWQYKYDAPDGVHRLWQWDERGRNRLPRAITFDRPDLKPEDFDSVKGVGKETSKAIVYLLHKITDTPIDSESDILPKKTVFQPESETSADQEGGLPQVSLTRKSFNRDAIYKILNTDPEYVFGKVTAGALASSLERMDRTYYDNRRKNLPVGVTCVKDNSDGRWRYFSGVTFAKPDLKAADFRKTEGIGENSARALVYLLHKLTDTPIGPDNDFLPERKEVVATEGSFPPFSLYLPGYKQHRKKIPADPRLRAKVSETLTEHPTMESSDTLVTKVAKFIAAGGKTAKGITALGGKGVTFYNPELVERTVETVAGVGPTTSEAVIYFARKMTEPVDPTSIDLGRFPGSRGRR